MTALVHLTEAEAQGALQRIWHKVMGPPIICWDRAVWQDVMALARLRGPQPFYRKRHRRMAGK